MINFIQGKLAINISNSRAGNYSHPLGGLPVLGIINIANMNSNQNMGWD